MKRLGIQIFHNTQYYQKYSLILDMNWSAIPFLIHRVWKKKTWRKRRTQQGNGNLNIPKQLSGCTLTSWSAAAPWCMWYMFTCRSKFQRWCIEAPRGLKCICISLFQSTSFASSAAVFLINMKQNVLVWQPQQVVLLKKERQKKKITAFFPPSSPIFSYFPVSAAHWVLQHSPYMSSAIFLHLQAFQSVCSCAGSFKCVWSTEMVIWLLDKQNLQAVTASSISLSDWWTGLCRWGHYPQACVCVSQLRYHTCYISLFIFYSFFFYPIPLTLTSGNTVNITLLLLH